MKIFNKLLYRLGFLHEEHSQSEHIAGYVTSGNLLLLIALMPVVIIDELIFNNVLHEYLLIIGKLALGGFGVGCVLILLATNEII